MELTRRNFLRMAGIGGVVMASGTALAGCSNSSTTASADSLRIAGMEDVNFTEETELLIIGSGIAGFSAATCALQQGITPLIVEKQQSYGGESVLACGSMMVLGIDYQVDNGAITSFDDIWALFGEGLTKSSAMPDYVANEYKYDVELFNICTNKYGAQWAPINQNMTTQLFPGKGVGDMPGLFNPWYQGLVADGARFLFETRATNFIVDGSGEIMGVRCADERTGATVDIKANAVIIATGGYSSNQEMITEYLPDFAQVANLTNRSMGEGHALGVSVGAALDQMDTATYFMGDLAQSTVWGYFVPTLGVLPNGKRFIAEMDSHGFGKACKDAGFNEWWLVLDNQAKTDEWTSYSVNSILSSNADRVVSAATPAELAKKMEVNVENFVATFERFNTMAEAGTDEGFGRTPQYGFRPFDGTELTAIKVFPMRYKTFGGFKVDNDSRVLDEAGAPIAHLWAAGSTVPCTGSNLCPNAGSGWIAALSACASLQG